MLIVVLPVAGLFYCFNEILLKGKIGIIFV